VLSCVLVFFEWFDFFKKKDIMVDGLRSVLWFFMRLKDSQMGASIFNVLSRTLRKYIPFAHNRDLYNRYGDAIEENPICTGARRYIPCPPCFTHLGEADADEPASPMMRLKEISDRGR